MPAKRLNRKCSIDGCNSKHVSRGWCNKHYLRWKLHGSPTWEPMTEEERFWAKVERPSADSCWEWQAWLNHRGYGQFSSEGATVLAHRFSFELANKRIPDGLMVCHSCDNPKCVNPAHLFLGTHQDNMNDRNRKQRQARGTRQGSSKLSPDDVRTILSTYEAEGSGRYGMKTASRLAKNFGVHRSTIEKVIRRHRWKHVS